MITLSYQFPSDNTTELQKKGLQKINHVLVFDWFTVLYKQKISVIPFKVSIFPSCEFGVYPYWFWILFRVNLDFFQVKNFLSWASHFFYHFFSEKPKFLVSATTVYFVSCRVGSGLFGALFISPLPPLFILPDSYWWYYWACPKRKLVLDYARNG